MALLARSLGRSARIMARRGPIAPSCRPFSATARTFLPEDPPDPIPQRLPLPDELPQAPEYSPDKLSKEERKWYDALPAEEREELDAEQREDVEDFSNMATRETTFNEIKQDASDVDKEGFLSFDEPRRKVKGFWSEAEDDEFCLVEDEDEVNNDDDITSMAHAELEVHREIREYARIAAWDMPFLSKLAQPFTLPDESHILRFRYTTYMGESHPAEYKVVVELSTGDLVPKHLSEAQRQTFLKLVGPRFNPQTDIVRMSCEKFSTRAQNKRYLGDIIGALIKEAKEGDSFADVPLDLRHHKPKPKYQFPESWVLTEKRKLQLETTRAERLRLQKEREAAVNGNAVIANAIKTLPAFNPALRAQATEQREKVAVRVGKSPKQRLR